MKWSVEVNACCGMESVLDFGFWYGVELVGDEGKREAVVTLTLFSLILWG